MTTPNTWRPDGASNHADWKIVWAYATAVSRRTAVNNVAHRAAEQEAVRAVNEMLANSDSGAPQPRGEPAQTNATQPAGSPNIIAPSSDAAEVAVGPVVRDTNMFARLANEPPAIIPDGYSAPLDIRTAAEIEHDRLARKPAWEPGRNSPRQNEARAYADLVFALSAPMPSPDGAAVNETLDNCLRIIRAEQQRAGTLNGEMNCAAIEAEVRKLYLAISPSPARATELDAIEIAYEAAREETVQAAAAEPDDDREARSDLAQAIKGERHTARFLARLVCTRGVAYGAYLESADAWVDANWRFFLGDARRLGGIAPVVRVTREAIQEACDLLAERKYGSPARSPGHNARLLLESILRSPASDATVSGGELTPVQLSIINDMTHAWIDDPAQHRIAFRNDCKRLLASSSQDVGREATVEAWLPIDDAARDGREILLRQGIAGPIHAGYCGLASMAFGAGASTNYPWTVLDNTNGVNHLKAESVTHYRSLAANGGGRG